MFYFCSGVQVIEIMNLHMYSSFLYFSLDQFNWMIFRWGCLDSLMLNPVCPGSLMIGPFLLAIKFICQSSVFEGWWSSTAAQRLSREGEVGMRERSHFHIFAEQTMTGGWVKKAISGCFCFLPAYWVVGRRRMEFCPFSNRVVDWTIFLNTKMLYFVYIEVVDFMARLHHNLENFIRISRRDICRYCHGTQ